MPPTTSYGMYPVTSSEIKHEPDVKTPPFHYDTAKSYLSSTLEKDPKDTEMKAASPVLPVSSGLYGSSLAGYYNGHSAFQPSGSSLLQPTVSSALSNSLIQQPIYSNSQYPYRIPTQG